jgi:Leucine-rich repeat (LRR) protein
MDFNGLFTLALITIFSFTVAAQESTASISETILTTEEVTSTSGLSEETGPSTSQTPVKIQPRTQTRINDPNGLLCEPDNDEIGRHLGCSCANLTVGGIVTADCSEKWIGMKNISLPHRMNISRHVRILDLSKNELTFVDEDTFGDCDGLFSLILHKNHIQEIQGLHCKWLKKLDLSWNNIQGLSNDAFQNLTRLQELDLSYNNLLFVEPKALDQLHLLRTLNLASNPLGKELNYADDYTLALDNLINLTELDMSNCSFPDFPLSLITGSVNLKRLVLRNNQISSLSDGLLHQLSELTELDLSGNWFETITPQMFLGLQSLRFLRIDKMPFLKTIEAHAFAGLISLDELSCQKNHYLTLIDPMAFRVRESVINCHTE